MNKLIYKYTTDSEEIPYYGTKFLHAGYDSNNTLCLWFEVSTDNLSTQSKGRKVKVVGTGDFAPDEDFFHHVQSVISPTYRLVWHIYLENV